MKEFYPFKNNYISLEGLRYHYVDEGEGPPVVMLHGNPTWSFYYRDLVKRLRGRHRTIVPDHIGCGFSDKPGDSQYPYTLEQRYLDLKYLLETLGIKERITLVVHDWGGMIGMLYATRHPEQIERIVVLNTGAFFLPASKPFPLALHLCRLWWLGDFLVRGMNLFCRGAAQVGCKRFPLTKELKEAYISPYDSWDNRIAIHRFVQDIPLKVGDRSYREVEFVQNHLHRLRELPMLICWGGEDFVFDHHFLQKWKGYFPRAKVQLFPDGGHYILEDAKEEIIPLIEDFIEEGKPAPAPRA